MNGLLKIIALCQLLFLGQTAFAQKFIRITHKRTHKVHRFTNGKRIVFVLKGTRQPEWGRIQTVTDSGFWVNERHVLLDSLQSIGEGGYWIKCILGAFSTATGVLLIASIPEGGSAGLVQYIAGQTLVGNGLILFFLNGVKLIARKRYEIGENWSAQIRSYRSD